jgi:hypothetical protein
MSRWPDDFKDLSRRLESTDFVFARRQWAALVNAPRRTARSSIPKFLCTRSDLGPRTPDRTATYSVQNELTGNDSATFSNFKPPRPDRFMRSALDQRWAALPIAAV